MDAYLRDSATPTNDELVCAIYMEDAGGAQEGIIEVEPSPYEIR
jgi:hypothetical protein